MIAWGIDHHSDDKVSSNLCFCPEVYGQGLNCRVEAFDLRGATGKNWQDRTQLDSLVRSDGVSPCRSERSEGSHAFGKRR